VGEGRQNADGLRPAVGHRTDHSLPWYVACDADRQFQQAAEGGPIWLFGLEGRTDRQFQQAAEGGLIELFGLKGRADRQFQQAAEGGPIGLFGLEGRPDLYAPRLDIGSGFRVPIGTAMVSSEGSRERGRWPPAGRRPSTVPVGWTLGLGLGCRSAYAVHLGPVVDHRLSLQFPNYLIASIVTVPRSTASI
jgi:hypothetical protein